MAKTDNKAPEIQIETQIETRTEEDAEGLVKMHKDGECLHVHPTTVEAHKSAGWKLA